MSIPIIDQLRPLGNFPAVDASDVQVGNQRLSTVLSNTPTTAQVDAVVANKVDKVDGKGLSTNDYTNAEKNKLSGIEANANNYVHPTTAGNKHIPAGGSAGKILGWDSDGTAKWVDDHNTEYSDATAINHGLMSSSDKVKLNGIESQANKTVISTSIPSNPSNYTVPSMKLVDDKYAKLSDLAEKANTSDVNTALAAKANNSTVSSIASQVSTNTTDIAIQTARIDGIAALPSGSTAGDAELMDIRVKSDGTTATDAGTAVREQITDLNTGLYNLFGTSGRTIYFTAGQRLIDDGSTHDGEPEFMTSNYVDVSGLDFITYTRMNIGEGGYYNTLSIAFYDSSKTKLSGRGATTSNRYDASLWEEPVPNNAVYARFCFFSDATVSQYGTPRFMWYVKDSALDDLRNLVMTNPSQNDVVINGSELIQGSVDYAERYEDEPSSKRLHSRLIPYDGSMSNRRIVFIPNTKITNLKILMFDRDFNYVDQSTYSSRALSLIDNANCRYIMFCFSNSNNDDISVSDYDAFTCIVSQNIMKVKLEGGGLSEGIATWELIKHKNLVKTAYTIKINDALGFLINQPDGFTSTTQAVVCFYDDTYTMIDTGIEYEYDYSIVVPANAKYLRIMLEDKRGTSYALPAKPKTLSINYYGIGKAPEIIKNPHYNTDVQELTFDVEGDICSRLNVKLPYNYDPEGEPVPLILFLPPTGGFENWGSSLPSTQMVKNIPYLCDEGFAVMYVYSWGSEYYEANNDVGKDHPFPVPTNRKVIKKAVEYVCDRFNVDSDNVHVMCKSRGGQLALFYASVQDFPIKSIGMFAPVLDALSMTGSPDPADAIYANVRQAIAKDLNLTGPLLDYYKGANFVTYAPDGKQFWRDNIEADIMINAAFTNLIGGTASENLEKALSDCEIYWTSPDGHDPERTDIYNHPEYKKIGSVPVKIWGAVDDESTPYRKMVEVVEQLKNGGCEAHMRSFEANTGGHNACDLGSNVVASVTTLSGTVYTNVSTGYVENVEWIRRNMVK